MLYNLEIPPEIRDTWAQLRGLAWNSEKEPPEFEMNTKELITILGKKQSTFYGHLAFLRDRGWLLFGRAQKGILRIAILGTTEGEPSRILENDNIKDLALSGDCDSQTRDSVDLVYSDVFQNFGKQARAVKDKIPAHALKPMVFALANVTGLDAKLNFGRLAKEAKAVIQSGYSPEQVTAAYSAGGAWYSKDWRGRKGQTPNTANIRETIKELCNGRNPDDRQKYIGGKYADSIEH
jgi:hypothetical protein